MYDLPSIKYSKTKDGESDENKKGKLKGGKNDIQAAVGKNQETLARIRAERIEKARREKEEKRGEGEKVSMSQLLNKKG